MAMTKLVAEETRGGKDLFHLTDSEGATHHSQE